MTPVQIEVILHYRYSPNHFNHGGDSQMSRAHREAHQFWEANEMMTETTESWSLTDKGRAYVEELMAVPLPVAVWTFPPKKEKTACQT